MMPKYFIVIDSNIWVEEMGLNSAIGAATRCYIRSQKAILALPEVIKREFESNYFKHLVHARNQIQTNYSKMVSAFGSLPAIKTPSDAEIKLLSDSFFDNLNLNIKPIPFSLDSAHSSFLKTVNKEPPSEHQQQFKDGVIWADCVNLLNEADVHFVSKDKAFYIDKNPSKGLAKNLLEECKNKPYRIFMHSSLASLIDSIKVEFAVDADLFESSYLKHFNSTSTFSPDFVFSVQSIKSLNTKAFITETADLSIDFEAKFIATVEIPVEAPADYTVLGSCHWDTTREAFYGFNINLEEVTYADALDENKTRGRKFLYASGFAGGHEITRHSIRDPVR